MATCANSNCPDADNPLIFLRETRHVQILDQELRTTGDRPAVGTTLYHFAAVTCSLRCAAAVLAPAVEEEERQRQQAAQRRGSMFGSSRSED